MKVGFRGLGYRALVKIITLFKEEAHCWEVRCYSV